MIKLFTNTIIDLLHTNWKIKVKWVGTNYTFKYVCFEIKFCNFGNIFTICKLKYKFKKCFL